MARPKGTDLTALLQVRFNADDKARLEITASNAGLSVSEFVRRASMNGSASASAIVRDDECNAALISAINRAGVNLNQIARVANSTNGIDYPALADTLERLNALLDRLLSGEAL